MPDAFLNPGAFFALLAIPAILIIHLLREKSRRVQVSTLFLLEEVPPRTPRGRAIHYLQHSVPLWMQLLVALLCTWLLAQPQWLRRDTSQRVAVVLDNTASMTAFRAQILSELPKAFNEISKAAAATEWNILTSSSPEAPLYRGGSLAAAVDALQSWSPALPHHDASHALSMALLDVRAGGSVLFVTDHQPDAALPSGVSLAAYGRPIENCGFAGSRAWTDADGPHWEVLIRNAGSTPQVRDWWVESDQTKSRPQKLTLAPGQLATIPGPFPPGEKRVSIHLSPDTFSLDDVMPVVAPEPKPFAIYVHASPSFTQFAQKIIKTIPGCTTASTIASADAAIVPEAEAAGVLSSVPALVIGPDGGKEAKTISGGLASERHPLVDGLVWNGLLSSGPARTDMKENEEALLWQEGKPLIILHSIAGVQRLILNFDVDHSNAARLPAMILLVSRFLVDAQAAKQGRFAGNFETHQTLPPFPPGAQLVDPSGAQETSTSDMALLRAPLLPGFFQVRLGETPLLDGAAYFGDPRESDFRSAFSSAPSIAVTQAVQRRNSSGDRFASLWLILIGAALCWSWQSQHRVRL